jgi:glycosidase
VNPSLYQLNTRTYLSTIKRNATLDDIPSFFLESLARQGFEWLWLLGVWEVGPTSAAISRSRNEWRSEFIKVLPDLTDQDICGSPFAICRYEGDPTLGGTAALVRFRTRLNSIGLKLMLDFIPNHVGFDHPWVRTHPEYLITGTPDDLGRSPDTWVKLPDGRIVAYGRDPNFPGWPDTVQLNFFNPALRLAVHDEVCRIADLCDGLRCDMAMLIEPEVFRQTWEKRAAHCVQGFSSIWPETIASVKQRSPEFLFLAEVYWNYEQKLQNLGFDYTYDKTLYDRVFERRGPQLRHHLVSTLTYQGKMARFLENHDEPRVASQLSPQEHAAAATVTYLAPGMRFFHDGQLTGRRVRIPVHLKRAPQEKVWPEVESIYKKLLPIINSPVSKHGAWNLLDTNRAWSDNPTNENFICYLVEHPLQTLLVVVNFASYRGQCFVRIPDRIWLEQSIELRDLLSQERLVRSASDLLERGLFVDMAGWQSHIFTVEQG